jgi:SNF2 family DNA or RNA helicase
MEPIEDYVYKIKPMAHQLESIRFFLANPRSYNHSDIGTGKTLSMLWTMDQLMIAGEVRKVLIISTLSTLRSVWGRELITNFPHRAFTILHGPKKTELIKSRDAIHIINHDGIVGMLELLKDKYDLIIIDEMTAFKSNKASRTNAMIKLSQTTKYVYGLSGNPVPNSPLEAWPQAKIVNPQNELYKILRTYTMWQRSNMVQISAFKWVAKPQAAEYVARLLQPSVRFERDECIDIPECQSIALQVPMSAQQKRIYEEIAKVLYAEINDNAITAVNAAVKLGKLLQVGCGSILDDERQCHFLDVKQKIDALKGIIDDSANPVIVYVPYRGGIELLKKELAEYVIAEISGSVKQEERAEIIRRFQLGEIKVLIIQPMAAAHGITLTRANIIVWFSLLASGEIYNQANGRITRIGQKRKQVIYHLISNRAEEHIYKLLAAKKLTSDAVLTLLTDRMF